MQCSVLVLLVVAVTGSQACTYFCKTDDGLSYTCCDHLYTAYVTGESTAASPQTSSSSEESSEEQGESVSRCYYYCSYDGDVYCCADNSKPIPASHDPHPGRCAEDAEQVCKSSGIYLLTKKAKVGKTSGSLQLASEEGKQLETCASDGYCLDDQKCCPSKCGRKHVCLKSLKDEGGDEE